MTHDQLLAKIDEEGEFQVQYFDSKPRMITALRAVVELHKPYEKILDGRPFASVLKSISCEQCKIKYPCQTIQSIENELG
jgi:hypothetical protein